MEKMNSKILLVFISSAIVISSCQSSSSLSESESSSRTPVTITNITHEAISETVELNATATFLLKTNVKVNANGYLQKSTIQLGNFITKGEILFELKTKEATTLDNTINSIDTSFHFKGTIVIKAPSSGYITNIDHQAGDYVQDGDQVATISDKSSFAFILNLPYELTSYISLNSSLQMKLPDNSILTAKVERAMPTMDPIAQTQNYVLKTDNQKMIPENLIAKVLLVKKSKSNVTSLPKASVLTNEVQSNFWIMKLINDSIAIQVPVTIGLQGGDKIEILSPELNEADRIVLSGNYGLEDSSKVKVIE